MNKPTRTANLERLIKEFGSVQVVADLADTTETYLNEILRGAKLPSGELRGVGNKLARKLEDGCGKPPNWMDVPYEKTAEPDSNLSAHERELLLRFRRAGDDLKNAILTVARLSV